MIKAKVIIGVFKIFHYYFLVSYLALVTRNNYVIVVNAIFVMKDCLKDTKGRTINRRFTITPTNSLIVKKLTNLGRRHSRADWNLKTTKDKYQFLSSCMLVFESVLKPTDSYEPDPKITKSSFDDSVKKFICSRGIIAA